MIATMKKPPPQNPLATLPLSQERTWLRRLLCLPVPLLLVTMAVLWAADLRTAYESPQLLLALNFVFSTLVSLFVAYLIGRSFLVRGSPGLLMLGCGVVIWGTAGLVGVAAALAGTSAGPVDVNTIVTIHNSCVWLSALCHLSGAVLSLRPGRAIRAAGLWLTGAYMGALGAVGLVTLATLAGWTATFFVQGQGGTPLREVVLGSAIAMFALTAALLVGPNRKPLSAFRYWYAFALALISVGLFGVLIESVHASPLSWTGRAAQFLSGVYMFIAAIASVRESRVGGISLEAALSEAKQQYEDLFSLAADGIVVHELASEPARGKIIQANPAICDLLGYTSQEMLGLTPLDIIAPQDRQALAREAEILARDGVLRHEKTLVGKDGRRIPVEIGTRFFRYQGRPMVMSTIRDVTEHKRAEDALLLAKVEWERTFDSVPDLIAVLDDRHRIVRVNKAMAQALHATPEACVGRLCYECVHGTTEPPPFCPHSKSMADGREHVEEVHEPRLKVDLLISTTPTRDDHGRVTGSVHVARDITERKQAEANQALLTDILQCLNRGGNLHALVAETLRLVREATGFDAVGLRLRQGEDCPYFENNGFSQEFLREENFLCERRGDGAIVRDADGRAVLQCTCGLVLSGRTDPNMPCFTEGGSFWSNVSTELLSLPPEDDPRTNPRNRCIHTGYQSVGLFPVKAGEEIMGLLQLNDRRPGRFTPELIAFYETLAQNIGLALQRTAAEESLRGVSVELRRTLDTAATGLTHCSRDLRYISANPAYARLVGLPLEQIVGRPIVDVMGQAGFEVIRPHVERVLRGEREEYEAEVPFAVSGKRFLHVVYTPDHDGEGKVVGWVASVSDITERKQAERGLRESEERLRLLGDNLPTSAVYQYTHEPDGTSRFLYISAGVEQLIGVKPQDVLRDPALLHSRILPEYFDAVVEAEAVSKRELSVFNMEVQMRRMDGQVRWMHLNSRPQRLADGRVVWDGVQTDVTQRKQAEEALRESEERFRTAFENSAIAMALTLQDGRLLRVNQTFCRMLGYSEAELAGRPFAEVTHPDDLTPNLAGIRQLIAGERPSFRMEKRYIGKDGSVIWGDMNAACVRDSQGRMLYLVTHVQDITERKQAEQQLKALNATLEQRVSERTADAEHRATQLRALAAQLTEAEQKERQRLATILHDHLQQLLVGTKFHLGVLRGQLRAPQQRDLLKQVDNLLDESLDASRTLTVDLSPPILQQGTMAQVLQWLGHWFAGKHGLKVEVHVDERADPQTPQVRVLLFQAVRELLFNTVKHAKVGRASVELSRAGKGQIKVVVTDTGVGFDPSQPRSDKGKGSGFGLFSIRERLDWLGGSLEIQSAPGQGTRTTLIAPMRLKTQSADVPVALEIAPASGAQASGLSTGASRGKVRVLLADDHAVMRDGLSRLLQTQPSIEVVGQAADGRQAVDLARQLQPDVVIMDVNMPHLDGVEATRQIKARQPRVQVIGLSMFNEEGVVEAMKAVGAVEYLAKTSGPDALIAAISASVTVGP